MLRSFAMILDLLDRRERRQLAGLFLLTLAMGAVEVMGVAAVLPFLALVADPSNIESNRAAAWLYEVSGIRDTNTFMIAMGVLVFLFVLLTTLIKAGTFYALTYFTRMRVLSLATRLMARYLAQPYSWFLQRHSSDLGKTILTEVALVVNGPIAASLKLVASAIILGSLVIFLLVLQPRAAIGGALLFGGCYGLIYLASRNRLMRIGEERVAANRERFQVMQEAMGGIKNVKLLGLERSYLDRFRAPAATLARNQASLQIISEMPRHLLEVIAFGGMVLFVLWLLATSDGAIASVVPLLGVYAFAGVRMFPVVQQLFAATSAVRFGERALVELHAELTGPAPGPLGQGADRPALPLRRRIALENVTYTYPGAERPSLRGLSVEIEARTTVGIVGATGAGKTTVVDIVLGLLAPDEGRLMIDDTPIDDTNVRAWQKSVGYVPQDIFLINDTVAANIAFGVPREEIDMQAVVTAARHARLHEFVAGSLDRGYDTIVGERGGRLSGGQRQRIGIARALYHDPAVLVFDEATSALDTLTERAVLDAIRSVGHTKTIIMIAHRLASVRRCDKILMLDHGRLLAADTYDGLVESQDGFRALHAASA